MTTPGSRGKNIFVIDRSSPTFELPEVTARRFSQSASNIEAENRWKDENLPGPTRAERAAKVAENTRFRTLLAERQDARLRNARNQITNG
jgi:hypothetical protein